ncbi:phosphogluconate dehydratase [Aestuariicella hydrocarbonica]|uniref:phosphogluconate dehydratase n=1 Tax=Pseudomaricurvus hydrocarbonicus TaxID=1470433 RepID=UPI001AA083FD
MHETLQQVTDTIIERSRTSRNAYLKRVDAAVQKGPHRGELACGNLAHGFAACSPGEKADLTADVKSNIAIVSSYNDMLSAHQPFKDAPDLIKAAISEAGGVAQFAGGVPAMCDGVTQGQPGMELSLFSRDVIAMSTAVSLSHNMFDGALYLGVCDKIVPGLLIGALTFGHLPAVFVPAGPMTTGMSNKEKVRIRQLYAEGKIGRKELLEAESKSYHGPGTCTFYGTANSNQMMVEIMGLHLPGSSFINPYTPLRDELTKAAARQVLKFTAQGQDFRPIGHVIDEKAIVNAIVGLLATGGSTNHTIHLIAIARAAGIKINWDDFDALSKVVPLVTRIYPNGQADINHFQAAGGMGVLIDKLLQAGLLHADIITIGDDRGLQYYNREPVLREGSLVWQASPAESLDRDVLRGSDEPFDNTGGLHLLQGNLGRGVIKVSAVQPEHRVVEAPAIVFDDQNDIVAAFKAGKLEKDFVAVLRYQGPQANGMPELHKLTPPLGVLQDRGFKVALVTDGRMSGASGKVPAAIHLTPECAAGGPLAKVQTGDLIRLDANTGRLEVVLDQQVLDSRIVLASSEGSHRFGMGRELFGGFRRQASSSELGACTLFSEFDLED